MDEAPITAEPAGLTLLPEVEVRRMLGDRRLRFRVLAPPYRAAGIGRLRVLRISERAGHCELVAGYERYERLPGDRP